ncbi:MAG TPA: phage head closure protein [Rhizomicrobium sp.]|nr:phage head closure protein [Rhizomicrobium sp.]
MIASLNQRALLLANTLTPDGGGGFSDDWESFALVWVAVEPIGGTDAFGPDRLEARVRHKITLRRRPGITAGQRAQIGARLFRIHTVLDEGPQNALMILLCEELP